MNEQNLKNQILQEIEDSRMNFSRKMKLMKLLDEAFRNHLGIIFLDDNEIEQNDIFSRSM